MKKEENKKQYTFGHAAGEWMKLQIPLLKETSAVKYRFIVEKYLLPEFGNQPISEITRYKVSLFLTELLMNGGNAGNGLAPKTVTGVFSVLKMILIYAKDFQNIKVVDLNGINIKQPIRRLRVLSVNEQRHLEQSLEKEMTLSALGVVLSLYTGIRLGELCALKWGDISFTERNIYIHTTMSRIQNPDESGSKTQIVLTLPKSECSIRYIPIPEKIFFLLEKYRQGNETYFLTGSETAYVDPRTMENRFKKMTDGCGLNNVHFHTLRHTFATRCVELGFDIKSLSEILGHSSVRITLDRYVHPTMETKRKEMNKLSEFMKEHGSIYT